MVFSAYTESTLKLGTSSSHLVSLNMLLYRMLESDGE